jgi:hypothetical protein
VDDLRETLLARLIDIGRIGAYELTEDELRAMMRLKQAGVVYEGLFNKSRRNDAQRPDAWISLHPFYYLPGEVRDMDSLVFTV